MGKLSFSQTAMFGKFARSQMRVLYRKLYRKYYAATLEEREFAAPKWRLAILHELNPRILRSITKFPDIVIYSDSATTGYRLAALLFNGGQSGPPLSSGSLRPPLRNFGLTHFAVRILYTD